MIQDDKKQIRFYVDNDIYDDLNRMSDLEGMPRTKFMLIVIDYYIDNHYDKYRDLLIEKLKNGWFD